MNYFLLLYLLTASNLFAKEEVTTEVPYKVQVSQGNFDNKVEISWDSIPTAQYYTLERVYDTPESTVKGKKVDLKTNILVPLTPKTSFTDYTIPFGQHIYTVNAFKTNIAPIEETKRQLKKRLKAIEKSGTNIAIPIETNIITLATYSNVGHRKVSDKEFFLEFQKAIDSSLPRIRTMKMLNFFGEKKKGWKEGQLIYKTTGIIRKPFKVTITYKDFVDQSLRLNGTYEVQIFKLFAQDGKLVGTFHVDGIYKGTITHNLILDGGQSVGGTYDVQQEGGAMVALPWDVTTHPLDDTQYEDALKGTIAESETEEKKESEKE